MDSHYHILQVWVAPLTIRPAMRWMIFVRGFVCLKNELDRTMTRWKNTKVGYNRWKRAKRRWREQFPVLCAISAGLISGKPRLSSLRPVTDEHILLSDLFIQGPHCNHRWINWLGRWRAANFPLGFAPENGPHQVSSFLWETQEKAIFRETWWGPFYTLWRGQAKWKNHGLARISIWCSSPARVIIWIGSLADADFVTFCFGFGAAQSEAMEWRKAWLGLGLWNRLRGRFGSTAAWTLNVF